MYVNSFQIYILCGISMEHGVLIVLDLEQKEKKNSCERVNQPL